MLEDPRKKLNINMTQERPSLSRERVQSRDINDVLILEEGAANEDSHRNTFASITPS